MEEAEREFPVLSMRMKSQIRRNTVKLQQMPQMPLPTATLLIATQRLIGIGRPDKLFCCDMGFKKSLGTSAAGGCTRNPGEYILKSERIQ